MDKKVIIILVLVVIVVAGVGAALLLLNRQPVVTEVVPTPIATPIAQTVSQAELTASVSTPLSPASPGSIDIYIDTKSAKIDGFQFIATIGGTAFPTVPDADSVTDGTQIMAEAIPGLAVSTNSVSEQDGSQVVRFAMISSDVNAGYMSTGPTKVANIPVSSGSGGSVTLTFNQQNTRVRPSGGGEDVLATVSDATFPVSAEVTTATDSGSLASSTSTPPPAGGSTAVATATSTNSAFCLASCFTDNDCAAGFVCEADRCVNPACPTSQTCGCGVEQTTLSATATPLPISTSAPVETVAPVIAEASPEATPESVPEDLPTSGVFEYTLLLIGGGLLFLGGGVYLSSFSSARP